jgi:hypothetical protein
MDMEKSDNAIFGSNFGANAQSSSTSSIAARRVSFQMEVI